MDPLQKASGRGWVDERKGRLLGGKTVVTPSNQPEASFQGGRRIGVSRDDGRRGARVRVSCWEAASAGLCVCVCVYRCASGVWVSLGPSWLFVCLWASTRASAPMSTSVAPARAGCVGASLGTYLSGCECVRDLAVRRLSASEAVTPCSLA